MEAFASASPNQTEPFLIFCRSFSEPEEEAKKHAASVQQDAEAQPKRGDTKTTKPSEDESYPRHVHDTLFKVGKQYAECRCGPPSSPGRHWGRLELKANYRTMSNEILFHTVFSKKGSIEFAEKIKWQHIQFRVPRHVALIRIRNAVIIANPSNTGINARHGRWASKISAATASKTHRDQMML